MGPVMRFCGAVTQMRGWEQGWPLEWHGSMVLAAGLRLKNVRSCTATRDAAIAIL
jgi:hypothetical protein